MITLYSVQEHYLTEQKNYYITFCDYFHLYISKLQKIIIQGKQ